MKTSPKKSVLVIDDDVGMLHALIKVLTSAGLAVAGAASPGAAMQYLSKRRDCFDLVITDLRMPGLSGLGVLTAVTTAFPGVPIIIITAFGGPEAQAEAARLGAAAYLEKPIDTANLLGTIERVCGAK